MTLESCERCPRLVAGLTELKRTHTDWHNAPVPAAGPENAPLLMVGLAPGKKGANRTGVPFLGDSSSGWLRGRMLEAGLLDEHGQLTGVRITNAVKCLPPKNLPTSTEVRTCTETWLIQELNEPGLQTILSLGGLAHRAVNTLLGIRQKDHPFSHGAEHMHGQVRLISSFHPSPLNTQTGRLSPRQFNSVLHRALGQR